MLEGCRSYSAEAEALPDSPRGPCPSSKNWAAHLIYFVYSKHRQKHLGVVLHPAWLLFTSDHNFQRKDNFAPS